MHKERTPTGLARLAAGVPRTLSLEISDFDDLARLFARWEGRIEQLSRGPFRGSVRVVQGRIVRVFRAETTQAIQGRGQDGRGLVSFTPVTSGNAETAWQGRQLPPGKVVLRGTDVELRNRPGRDSVSLSVQVPAEVMREAARVIGGFDPGAELANWAALGPPPQAVAALECCLAGLLRAGLKEPAIFAGPEGLAQEIECLRVLTDLLAQGMGRAGCGSEAGSDRARLVGRAEEFMRSRLQASLSTFELCEELGVGDRALRLAFRERFGMGPLAYFRVLRLNAVHAALRSARGGVEGVADLARHWGFSRLGSFAAEYRLQFGEPPSRTLGVRGWPGVQEGRAFPNANSSGTTRR